MPDKQPLHKHTVSSAGLRPGQDFVSSKARASYPGVGMTLSSYRNTDGVRPPARPKAKTVAGAAVAAKHVSSQPKPIPPAQAAAVSQTATAVSSLPATKKKTKKRGWRRFFTLKKIVVYLLVAVLLMGGWVGGKFLYNTHKLFGGSLLGFLQTTKLKGEDVGRVNILLAGNSADDPGHGGADLTDSIMLVSINTKDNTGFMVSIPRDLWVNIPGSGYAKINSAYVTGNQQNFQQYGLPNGGMGELEAVVEKDFGVNINYYALVNYSAFRDAVNAVGGIDVNIQSTDPRGLYDPNRDYVTNGPLVKLPNGVNHLNGEQALDLARARGDPSQYGYPYGFPASDFDRTNHQRQMLLALKTKAVSAGVVANPAKLSSLFDAIGKNVKTDMSLSEAHRLYDIGKNINSSGIQSVSLSSADGKNLLMSYASPDGQSALAPAAGLDDYSQVDAYLMRLMSNNPVVREDAKVVVLNASDTAGLAGTQKSKLTAKGINVIAVGDATAMQANTVIIDSSDGSKTATKQLLQGIYGSTFTKTNPYSGIYDADYIVIVGSNLAAAQTQSSAKTTQ